MKRYPVQQTIFFSRKNSNPKISQQKVLNYKASVNKLDSHLVMSKTAVSNNY